MNRWMMIFSFSVALMSASLLGAAGCGSSTDGGGGSCAASTPSSCPGDAPSYANDVAPIFKSKCETCHAPGGQQASQPLQTYSDVSALSAAMKTRVGDCTMPPADAAALTADEADTILAWLVCGAADN